jgi:hypothetical protein
MVGSRTSDGSTRKEEGTSCEEGRLVGLRLPSSWYFWIPRRHRHRESSIAFVNRFRWLRNDEETRLVRCKVNHDSAVDPE